VVTSFNARGYRAGDRFVCRSWLLLCWTGCPPASHRASEQASERSLPPASSILIVCVGCWTSRTNASRKSSRKLQVVGILNHLRRSSIGSSEQNEPVNEPEKRECAGVAKNRQGYRRNESEVEEESANTDRGSQSSVSENKWLAGGTWRKTTSCCTERERETETETETEIQREEESKESVRESTLERRGKSQGQGSRGENEKAEGGRYTEEMAWWDGYISDDVMGTIAPLVIYWLYAGLYHMLPPLDRFRLHSVQEEEQRNLVTLPQVVKGVLLQQAVQAVVAFLLFAVSSFSSSFSSPTPPPLISFPPFYLLLLCLFCFWNRVKCVHKIRGLRSAWLSLHVCFSHEAGPSYCCSWIAVLRGIKQNLCDLLVLLLRDQIVPIMC